MCFYSATSQKSARSCGDRHFREAHTSGTLCWRRARRQVVARLSTRAAKHAEGVRCAYLSCAPCAGRRDLPSSQLPGSRLRTWACPFSTHAGCRGWTSRALRLRTEPPGRAWSSAAPCSETLCQPRMSYSRPSRGSGTSSLPRTHAA